MFSSYDFGYSWFVGYGLAIPLAVAALAGGLALRRRWPRWTIAAAAVVAIWAATGIVLINFTFGLERPLDLPTARFLPSGAGRVLDAGAGSGRAAVGVLLARPKATVTGLDLYDGYWGIEDNTPERFMANARIAGAAERADAVRGDLRAMPFRDGEFDAVISSYAIDHLRQDGVVKAIAEVARVLKPRGEFLLLIVHVNWATWLVSPHSVAHHPRQDPMRWRDVLESGGFDVEETGTRPSTLYFLARKRGGAATAAITAATS
ncbi:MAG: class I SAM-dependent methyltransferase [Acidimicrobiia bacterium]|nr:class I SAM-dependent methyltransferase [Acidimicrobiia bacterium]